jgi:hypothetical protein
MRLRAFFLYSAIFYAWEKRKTEKEIRNCRCFGNKKATHRLPGLATVRALLERLVELEEAIHGDNEDVREVVGDGLVEIAEFVRAPVDGRNVGRERKERNGLDVLQGVKMLEASHELTVLRGKKRTHLKRLFKLALLVRFKDLLQPEEDLARLPVPLADLVPLAEVALIVFEDAARRRAKILFGTEPNAPSTSVRCGRRGLRERRPEGLVEDGDDGVVLFSKVVEDDSVRKPLLGRRACRSDFDDREKV